MELLAGLNRDVSPLKLKDGEWRDARNMVMARTGRGLSNEEGFEVHALSEDAATYGTIIGIIPTNNGYVQFNKHVNGLCVISVIRDNVPTVIIQDSILGFKTTNPIRGVYQYNYAGELVIAWWEGLATDANVPRILNVDCLPFELNVDKSLVNDEDIILLNQFSVTNNAAIDLLAVMNGGGAITTGVYYVTIAYKYPDGSRTNFFEISNQISIIDEASTEPYIYIDGAPADSTTGKAIKLQFNNLDTRYSKLCVGIISKIGGVISTQLVAELDINDQTTLTWVYNGTQLITDIDSAEILVPYITYDRVQTGVLHEDKLYQANLRGTKAPDIQQYVNNIKVNWAYVDELEISSYAGSYKNPLNVFYFRTWRSFAVYALYLIVHMTDGSKWAYHIPGRVKRTDFDFGDAVVGAEDLTLDALVTAGVTNADVVHAEEYFPDTKYYQLFDTADTDGLMGYWANNNESYADVSCNDIKNCAGAVIGTLRNTPVRHHRFPSTKTLTDLYGDIFTTEELPVMMRWDLTSYTNEASFPTPPIGFGVFDLTVDNTNGAGAFDTIPLLGVTQKHYVFSELTAVTIRYFIDVSDIDDYHIFQIRKFDPVTSTYETIFEDVVDLDIADSNADVLLDGSVEYTFQAGEVLVVSSNYSTDFSPEDTPDVDTTSYVSVSSRNPSDFPTSRKLLALTLDDFCIPSDLRGDIVSYELGYAERTSVNNLVFDQDVIEYYDASRTFRAHPFDSLISRQNPGTDFIRTYYKFSGTSPFVYTTRTINNELARVLRSQYIPTNVSLPIDNENREELLYGVLGKGLTGATLATDYYADAYYLADFIRVVDDVYMDYMNQDIVRTGLRFVYDAVPATIYGGDNFLSIYGVLTSRSLADDTEVQPNDADQRLRNLRALLYPVESIANIGLRHSAAGNYYYPHDADYDNEFDPTDETVEPIINQTTNGLLYNTDYSSVNNIQPIVIVSCHDECSTADTIYFPHRIHRTVGTGREEYNHGWRVMVSNNYYEMPKNRGEIWKLSSMDDILIIQHLYGLFVAKNRDILEVASGTEIALGRGDLFTSEPNEIIPDEGGYIGCKSHWAAFVCKVGYVVVDGSSENRGKIFVYDGKVNEISAVTNEDGAFMMRNFFRANTYMTGDDNPFTVSGWAAAYDDKYNRLIFTKHLLVASTGNSRLTGFNNYTISFSIDRQRWVAFHDYAPNILFYNRNGLYSVFNNVLGLVYEHNIADRYGFYYNDEEDGDPIPAYVDAAVVADYRIAKHFVAISWITVVENSAGKILFDPTVTQFMIYTDDMCSGLITLTKKTGLIPGGTKIANNEYTWCFHNFRDKTIARDTVTINDDGTINTANLNSAKTFFKSSKFVGKFAIVRLQTDNIAQYSVTIEDVNAILRKSIKNV